MVAVPRPARRRLAAKPWAAAGKSSCRRRARLSTVREVDAGDGAAAADEGRAGGGVARPETTVPADSVAMGALVGEATGLAAARVVVVVGRFAGGTLMKRYQPAAAARPRAI